MPLSFYRSTQLHKDPQMLKSLTINIKKERKKKGSMRYYTCASIFEKSISGTTVSPPSLETVSAIASACELDEPSSIWPRSVANSSSFALSFDDASSYYKAR